MSDKGTGLSPAERFGYCEDVGYYIFMLKGKHLSGPSETAQHFINYHQNVVFIAQSSNVLKIACWRLYNSFCMNCLKNNRYNVIVPGVLIVAFLYYPFKGMPVSIRD